MTDEEIKALVDEFNRKVSLDPEIRSVMQKIRNQDADFSDTSRMFWRRSELLRNYLQGIVLNLPAGAREQLCTALLNAGYNETNKVMQSVQQAQDEPQGIHLNPVLPKRPDERIHTVAHALEDPTVPQKVIPSIVDIRTAHDRNYQYGIVACHNGNLFQYKITGDFNDDYVDFLLDKTHKIIYNTDKEIDAAKLQRDLDQVLDLLRQNNVELKVILWK